MERRIGNKRLWGFLLAAAAAVTMIFQGAEPVAADAGPAPARPQSAAGYGSIPIFFVPNQGQFDERVAYAVQGKDKSIYFTADGLTLVLHERAAKSPAVGDTGSRRELLAAPAATGAVQRRWVVRLDFVRARKGGKPESLEPAGTVGSSVEDRLGSRGTGACGAGLPGPSRYEPGGHSTGPRACGARDRYPGPVLCNHRDRHKG